MAGLFPLSRQIQFDTAGRVAAGARLFLYDGGTLTPRVGYRDLSLTTEHPNPIVADAAGRLPLIYIDDGFYRQRLTTSGGGLIFDDDNIPVLTTSAGGAGTTVDPDSVFGVRDVKIRFDDQPISGYVRLNGKSIGSASSGATERANSDTQALYEELWDYANISVAGGKGASAPVDFSANKALTLPNCQGASIFGMPDMGGTADSAFAALLTGTTSEPGATAGADTVTIAQGNLPSYNLTGGSGTVAASGTTSTESATHTHGPGSFVVADTQPDFTAEAITNAGDGTRTYSNAESDASKPVTGTSGGQSVTHTHTVAVSGTAASITISSGGSGTALNKLPSLVTFMLYLKL